MFNYIVGSLTTLLALFLGYLLGSSTEPDNKVTFKKVGQFLNKANPLVDNKVGAIERPTAQDIIYRDNPKLREENEAMAKTFSELVPKP